MPANELTSWKCEKCGSVLGIVRRDNDGVRRLNILRFGFGKASEYAVNLAMAAQQEGVNIYSVSNLDAGDVYCFCGAVRTWRLSQELMDKIVNDFVERSK